LKTCAVKQKLEVMVIVELDLKAVVVVVAKFVANTVI